MDAKEKTKKYYEIIIKNVKKKRIEKNISQKKLSIRIDGNNNYIKKIENNELNPSLEYLFRICNELDINFLELLKEEN